MDKDRIIYEDKYILIYNKPAGIAVQTGRITEVDLESEIRNYLARPGSGNPYLGLVHRLDQPVEGLVLFAKTGEAAALLSKMIGNDGIVKKYMAVVEGRPKTSEGELKDFICWDGRKNVAMVVAPGTKKASESRLQYAVVGEASPEGRDISKLDIRLYTGRHHQIRVQLSHMGCPIIGDRKYNHITPAGSGCSFPALCAYELSFSHPVTKKDVTASIKPSAPIFNIFQ